MSDKRSDYERIIDHLKGLADGTIEPLDTESGLCSELYYFIEEYLGLSKPRWFDFKCGHLRDTFKKWPKSSGSTAYPVPNPDCVVGEYFVDQAEDIYEERVNLWADDEYGNLRRELCTFVADELQESVDGEYVWPFDDSEESENG